MPPGGTDPNFQGIDPGELGDMLTSLGQKLPTARSTAESYLTQFTGLGLDAGPVQKLLADLAWATSQQPMLSYRLGKAKAAGVPAGTFTTQGAGPLPFPTAATAAKAGAATAKKLSALLAAGDDKGAEQQLAELEKNGGDSDFTNAFWNWVGKNDPALMALFQPGFLAYYESATRVAPAWARGTPAWLKGTTKLWLTPESLEHHAFGGETRAGRGHAQEFDVTTTDEYAETAYKFLQNSVSKGYSVKIATDDDGYRIVRIFDLQSDTMGVFSAGKVGSDGKVTGAAKVISLLKTKRKPAAAERYWGKQPGDAPESGELESLLANTTRGVDKAAPWYARVAKLADTPAGRAGGKALWVLGAAADVYTIADPSQNALGGATTERVMAGANLGAMAVGTDTAAGLIAANASLDWVPGVGEAVMIGTAAYFVGDLIYQNRQAIGHALTSAGHETEHLADDVGHGASHVWHSIFG